MKMRHVESRQTIQHSFKANVHSEKDRFCISFAFNLFYDGHDDFSDQSVSMLVPLAIWPLNAP